MAQETPASLKKTENLKEGLVVGGILLLLFLFASTHQQNPGVEQQAQPQVCSDGTLYTSCSVNMPGYCENGALINKASLCGCPSGYNKEGDACRKEEACADGTKYGECSSKKPYYCMDGALVKRAAVCGCPKNAIISGESCVSVLETGPINATLSYVLRGAANSVSLVTYSGLDTYLSKLPAYSCDPVCPSGTNVSLGYINQEDQGEYLKELVENIKSRSANRDDQARIAISMVQKIPLDALVVAVNGKGRYPYEVIYDGKGSSAEKSRLLAFLLRELGYGVVLFNYEAEKHMALGIKCPAQYSYLGSGHCFVETAEPAIITDNESAHKGVAKLVSVPEIIKITSGASLDSVSEEYADALEWNRISRNSASSGGVLGAADYGKWSALVNKYGIKLS